LSLSLVRDLRACRPRCPQHVVALRCLIVIRRKEMTIHRLRDEDEVEEDLRDLVVLNLERATKRKNEKEERKRKIREKLLTLLYF